MPPSGSAMIGGAKFQQTFLDWTKQSNQLYLMVFITVLVIWASFPEKMPMNMRWQLSTTLGRLLLLLLLYIIYINAGWRLALLFTIVVALSWASRPLLKPYTEGFDNVKTTYISGNKWLVEKILHEKPKEIVEDRVDTMAVQDDTRANSGKTSK